MKSIPYILLFIISIQVHGQSSVLSSGSWYKLGITETGIHKIDRTTLEALGIQAVGNPQKISLFGNAVKGTLPQSNSTPRPQDLEENAILVSGEGDGVFDQGDYILFYGIGPNKESWANNEFGFEKNIYSDTAFYFLRVGGSDGKRVANKESLPGLADVVISTFDDHIVFEEDERNLISSGRSWVGETLSNGESLSFSHQIDGLSSEVSLRVKVVGQSPEQSTFRFDMNGTALGSVSIASVPSGAGSTYSVKAREGSATFSFPVEGPFSLAVGYQGNATNARGFVDRYQMTFQRDLKLYANQTDFRVIGNEGSVVAYEVENAASAMIWDVTEPINVRQQAFVSSGSAAVFNSSSEEIEEYVVFSGADFPTPFALGKVENQDLRGDVNYDGLIITSRAFLNEANRLAQFHRDHDQLAVKVVSLSQVYNEFSSGRPDVTAIRDYARYVYSRGEKLKYLLLFGDCSYDYKDRVNANTNIVPTYESRNSFDPIFSYSSDDYFAFFEEEEGEWIESRSGDHTMDIGVGRLPVKSEKEAATVVDKIIYYSTSVNTLGKWRNEITYLADDGDFNIHARHVEDLSELVDTTYAQYNINKLLVDAFQQESGASKDLSPQTTAALKTTIKNGTFYVNFIGHGNERLWTEEEVLTRATIAELTNKNKLPIFVTATCEFGRYDDPFQVSGAEELLLSGKGGGIALLTTSRPVFASTNFSLNQAFHENMFEKINGKNQRLGDIIRFTKNEGLEGPVNRNFTLLGDPMMLPAFPKLDIVINELESGLDTLSALEEIVFSGRVEKDGQLQGGFNGTVSVAIFDVKQNFKTRGQESNPYTYSLRSNALFRGEALVVDGEFSFSFIVPKNISYQFSRGKMSLYAFDSEGNVDASGSSREFVIGGTAENNLTDTTPPKLALYLNDSGFQNGGTVGRSSLLIADVTDESGVTTARSGVVEGITLDLEGEIINLNNFYTATTEGYQRGVVMYPIQNLSPGRYSATLRVWDTHNNLSIKSIDFVVTDEPTLFITNQAAYPNPVKDHRATFYFEHDREDEDLKVSILVYSPRGEVVSNRQFSFENSGGAIEIPWQALTNSGQQLNQGVYYYRLIIQSDFDGATKEITQKLVIVD